MSEDKNMAAFEQELLCHVEMLYGVAFRLTLDSKAAERITRSTLLQAWNCREMWEGTRGLKAELLKLLRQTFLRQHRQEASTATLRVYELCPPQDSDAAKAGLFGRVRPTVHEPRLAAAPR